jgi:RNA polymerase-binding transcription factor DksA
MNDLTQAQVAELTERLRKRKTQLVDEIRDGLVRSGNERYADLLGGTGDAGDESVASLLQHVAQAEIIRDAGEVQDIAGAEQRLAEGRYGACIDCGTAIGYDRLAAYPSAKRCLPCQQRREKTRAPSKYTGR